MNANNPASPVLIQVPYNKCFETISNELRVRILQALMDKPMSVTALSRKLSVEQSRLSHSMQMLKTCSYVDMEHKGKEHIYSLKETIRGGLEMPSDKANIFTVVHRHAHTHCANGCNKLKQL
jgi:DNA-binding transcriptional ArsR family regulator